MVEVDQREREQRPGEAERRNGLPGGAEHTATASAEHAGGRLDARDSAPEILAPQPAQRPREAQEAHYRNVVLRPRFAAPQLGHVDGGQREIETARSAHAAEAAARFGGELGALRAPRELHHDREAVGDDVQEAADQPGPASRGDEERRRGQVSKSSTVRAAQALSRHDAAPRSGAAGRHSRAGVRRPNPVLKIGRYIAMTRPPTSTPRIAMISGSSKLDMLSTRVVDFLLVEVGDLARHRVERA